MPEVMPRIAWNNLLSSATLTASTTAFDHEVDFVADQRLYRTWKSAAGGEQIIEVRWTEPQVISCWCCYGHNIGQISGTIAAEIWNGDTWQPFGGDPIQPEGSACLYVTDTPQTITRARFLITGDAPIIIASLFLGNDMICQRGVKPGWIDPQLGQKQVLIHSASRSGLALPAIVEDEFLEGQFTLQDVTLDWAKNIWLPFKRYAQTQPFFLRWHENEAPAYCSNAQFTAEAFTRPGHVSVGFRCRMETA